jgi:hypothetical protein
MKLSVRDGVARFSDIPPFRYIGCTDPQNTRYPRLFESFPFEPKRGTSGILVFKSEEEYRFYQYSWKEEKLVVVRGVPNQVHHFSEGFGEDNFGVMVTVGDCDYVTRVPDTGGIYRLVDVISLMRYVEGRFDLKQLQQASGRAIRRIPYERRLQETELILRDNQILVSRNIELLTIVRDERVAKEKAQADLKIKDALIRAGLQSLEAILVGLDDVSANSELAKRVKNVLAQNKRLVAGF